MISQPWALSSGVRKLIHGATLHGAQWLDGSERKNPISYYYRGGAISQALSVIPSPRNIAVIGLGAGAAAAYAGEHDSITFYEIDPDIEPVARQWFTYLGDSKAKQEVIVGDGRLALQEDRAERSKYDLILIDAFTGDGIPVHLLTREAIEIYLTRLTADGLLIFHVSNRYYELRPVIKAIARDLNLHGAINLSLAKDQLRPEQMDTLCVALTGNRESLQPLVDSGWVLFGEDGLKEMAPWTDDYINILEPLGKASRRDIGHGKSARLSDGESLRVKVCKVSLLNLSQTPMGLDHIEKFEVSADGCNGFSALNDIGLSKRP